MINESSNEVPNELRSLYRIASIAAALKLIAILGHTITEICIGPKPSSAAAYFAAYTENPTAAFLRGDIFFLVLCALYLITFPALYATLRRQNPVYSSIAVLFTIIAVSLVFSAESTFSLFHLGKLFAVADEAHRSQLIAAAEAIIASDMWNSSAAYMSGILLQGSGVMISIIMLRSSSFSKVTAYAGLIGNAIDLFQHLLHPLVPSIAPPLHMIMGLFYLVWYFMLARDFFRLTKEQQ